MGERIGPPLSADELAEILGHALWTEAEQAALVRHIESQDATIANQNAEMDRLNGEVERLAAGNEHLVAEVRRALRKTRLGEVMGRGVMAEDVPLLDALLPTWPEGTDTTR